MFVSLLVHPLEQTGWGDLKLPLALVQADVALAESSSDMLAAEAEVASTAGAACMWGECHSVGGDTVRSLLASIKTQASKFVNLAGGSADE